MSFLALPRLAFGGRFLSDVSTINNANPGGDVGWNPQGGAAFEFLDCKVAGAWTAAGAVTDDPAIGYVISGRPDGSSAKMVDLDPDWQMASQLWALWVRLCDPASGDLAFIGRYSVSSFRDIWMRQCPEITQKRPLPNGQPMGARYVSTLTDIEWGPAADRSPLLSALRHNASKRLSIGLHQFGYFYATDQARYRTGALVGIIGPSNDEDPETVLATRRLQPVPLNAQLPCMGPIDFEASPDQSRISMDLGHALPIANVDGKLQDLGTWPALPQLAGCQALVLGVAQKDFTQWKVPSQAVQQLGEISPFGKDWYATTGGIATLEIAVDRRALITQPMALYGRLGDGAMVSITQEIVDGLLVRADNFVFRMEPGEKATAIIYARRFGQPAANVTLYLNPQTPLLPPALKFPNTITTDAQGVASLVLEADDPGAPRPSPNPGQPAPDGQVYIIGYSSLPPTVNGAGRDGTGLSNLDVLAVHVRQKFTVPPCPTWEDDVQPILAGYATLYPIMSKHLFNLADYNAVAGHRTNLKVAFNRNINDPNYMPVTRDLSESKRAIILTWLQAETGDPTAPLRRKANNGRAAPATHIVTAGAMQPDAPDAKRDDVALFKVPIASQRAEDSNDQG